MSKENSEFIFGIDRILTEKHREEILNYSTDPNVKRMQLYFPEDEDIAKLLEEFDLKGITLMVEIVDTTVYMKYKYKGDLLDPVCHYLQEPHHVKPEPLAVLREAIKQDTHKPDVRHLEEGK